MMRTANIPALQTELETLNHAIAQLQDQGVLLGHRIKVVQPRGTAGKPSQRKGYARLIDAARGSSRAIAPDQVDTYQSQIDRARELVRLQKRRDALLKRIVNTKTIA
jgi:hypothetical protein